MYQLARKHISCIGLVALLATCLGLPAQAQYSKVYQFANQTGVSQTSVKATTYGLESIIAQTATPSALAPGTTGTVLISGVYNTTLRFSGVSTAAGTSVTVGWQTADNSCRLRDLRWGTGVAVLPTQLGGVPGGGMMFHDWPNPGELTVVITNDTDGPLNLASVEYITCEQALSLEQLAPLAAEGLVELRVAAIDRDIDVLRAEVVYYGSLGVLPSPSVRSLTGKLDKAVALKHAGLTAYLAGDLSKALYSWQQAAKSVSNFISELTTSSTRGNIPKNLYARWIVDGGGQIATAPEIRGALLALPEGEPLQNLPSLPAGTPLPPCARLDPAGYRPWPVAVLNPGEYTAFVVDDTNPGAGFIMRGSVLGADGKAQLDWIEQAVVQPCTPDDEPPMNTSIVINGGDAYTASTDVTLDLHGEDNVGVVAYEVTDASGTLIGTVNPSESDFGVKIAGALSPGDGVKTVSARYCDVVGNWSELCVDSITLDQTAPLITATATNADGSTYTAGTWTNQDVTVHFECSDPVSGLASTPADVTVSTEGVTSSVTGTATDNAGNSIEAGFGPINIDKTPPTISGARTPDANAHGWNNTDVTVSFTASDGGSGIESVTPDTVVSTEGAGQSVTGTAVDKAGNSASATVGDINIDKTPPVVTIALPGTGEYVLNQPGLTATWSATDALSGVAPPSSGTIPIDTSALGTGLVVIAPAGTAVDLAGNISLEVAAEGSCTLVYGFGGLLSPYAPPPRGFETGGGIPLKWQYVDALGVVVDSSAAAPSIAVSPIGAPVGPGSRELDYDSTSHTWHFNWKTDGLAAGVYFILITSAQTGQTDGPFYIELK